jgi:hypothetical protein
MNKQYIGDSVYVELEDGMLKLTTENGMGPSNTIHLEKQVYDSLVEYVNWLKTTSEANHGEP